MSQSWTLLSIFLGVIYLICYKNSYVEPKHLSKYIPTKPSANKTYNSYKPNQHIQLKKHLTPMEYWNINDTRQIKFKSHCNNFNRLRSLDDQYHMIEIDIKTTNQNTPPVYQVLDNPYSFVANNRRANVFPRLDRWLENYLHKYKNKTKPGLKLNIHSRSDSIFQVLKKYKIDELGIPIWIGPRGVPGNTEHLFMFENLLEQTHNFKIQPTVVYSWNIRVLNTKKSFNSINLVNLAVMYEILEKASPEHLIFSLRAELLSNSWNLIVKNLFESEKLKNITVNNQIKSVGFLVEGKIDEKFYKTLMDYSESSSYPFFFDLRKVDISKIYPRQAFKNKFSSSFKDKFNPPNIRVESMEPEEGSLGETIAIDACFVFFIMAMCLLSIVMLLS